MNSRHMEGVDGDVERRGGAAAVAERLPGMAHCHQHDGQILRVVEEGVAWLRLGVGLGVGLGAGPGMAVGVASGLGGGAGARGRSAGRRRVEAGAAGAIVAVAVAPPVSGRAGVAVRFSVSCDICRGGGSGTRRSPYAGNSLFKEPPERIPGEELDAGPRRAANRNPKAKSCVLVLLRGVWRRRTSQAP